MNKPDFWNNPSQYIGTKRITEEISNLKEYLQLDNKLKSYAEDLRTYLLLFYEEIDPELAQEAEIRLQEVEEEVDRLEIRILLSGENDKNDAILTIHPGAGGTESQDWAEMLLRMYLRWASRNNFKVKMMDKLLGDEAGIKSATIEVKGQYAYGYLKSEIGIHRLVRISPFDANARRHTSFASVFVYPEIDDSIEVEIKEDDINIDTYRASGPGGQNVNKVSSAVRITHIPTNIVVQCQTERSQLRNRENAMKVLRARLYQYYKEQKDKERQKLENTKKDISWGHQIRSYIFHPYSMVKDHRSNLQKGNIQAVMDGEIDDFIYAYLKWLI